MSIVRRRITRQKKSHVESMLYEGAALITIVNVVKTGAFASMSVLSFIT